MRFLRKLFYRPAVLDDNDPLTWSDLAQIAMDIQDEARLINNEYIETRAGDLLSELSRCSGETY